MTYNKCCYQLISRRQNENESGRLSTARASPRHTGSAIDVTKANYITRSGITSLK